MSSTRPIRKSSRRSSPHRNATEATATPSADAEKKEKKTFLDKWVEPPLRPPAPSFEDHKGLERHGVLEYMAPLGSMPNAKVKARVKAEPPRRVTQVRNGENAASRERPATPETAATPTLGSRRSESRKVEDRTPKTPVSRPHPSPAEKPVVSTPKALSAPKASTRSTGKGANTHGSPIEPQVPVTPVTPHWRDKFKEIVDHANRRAIELKQPEIGYALQQQYNDSFSDPSKARLLEDVINKKATPEQTAEFQSYIRKAKKQFKSLQAKANGTRRSSDVGASSSSKSYSKSPSKSTRSGAASGTRNSVGKAVEATEARGPKFSNSHKKESKGKGKDASRASMTAKDSHVLTRSKSSTSSLSSLCSNSLDDENFAPSMEVNHASAAETPAANPPMNNSRSKTSTGPKLHTFSTSTQAPVVNGRKRTSSSAGLAQDDADAAVPPKRQRVAKTFEDVEIRDSATRGSPAVNPPPLSTRSSSSKPSVVLPLPASTPVYSTRLRDGSAAKKRFPRDEDEEVVSSPASIPGELPVPGGSTGGPPSRPSTPSVLGPVSRKSKKAARIKMSPFKKKTGVIAGIARERNSPFGYGTISDQKEDDNDELCSACGGQGELLCCDGCPSSFHFTCVDPPVRKEDVEEKEELWFCSICSAKKDPPRRHARGLFASLLDGLEKRNPVSFILPKDIRDYFEGVKTGDEGEYEEAVTQKSRTRGGYDEEPDLLKLKDAKGKVVLCFHCGKSALNGQKIIPCDYCSLQWHLDCLDPPMANPPPRAANGKPKNNWMCPNHIDHELLAIGPSVTVNGQTCNGSLRTHKVRRPKNAKIVDTHLRRGFVNNGLIEIENEPSDTEDGQFFDKNHFGIVYRLPERGIKLDFIAKVRSMREKEARAAQPQGQSSSSSQAPESASTYSNHVITNGIQGVQDSIDPAIEQLCTELGKRPYIERKAALSLAQFAMVNHDLNLNPDKVDQLINLLIAEAPPEVETMLKENQPKGSVVPPSPPVSENGLSIEERKSLLMLQELIRRRLDPGPTAP